MSGEVPFLSPKTNLMTVSPHNQMVSMKRHDSSVSIADSGRGSSMGSLWSLASSLNSTSSFESMTTKAKNAVKKVSAKLPKFKSKTRDKDKHQSRGYNFSNRPMREESVAQPKISSVDNQVDFNEPAENPPDFEKMITCDDSNRRRSYSSSSSTKSDESGEYRLFLANRYCQYLIGYMK